MIGIGPYIRPRVVGGLDPTLFLIEGSGVAAYSAFSFRGLSSNYVGGSGKCCRIRRSNDNAETDIGFVKSGNDWVVDEAAMTTFTGANNAFIVRMYDQTGNNRDRYSGIANRQPIIVLGGTVQKYNGYPAALFNNQNHTLQTLFAYSLGASVWPSGATQMSSIYVAKQDIISGSLNNDTSIPIWDNGGGQYAYTEHLGSGGSAFAGYTAGTQYKNNLSVSIVNRDNAYVQLYNQRWILEDYGFTKWTTEQNNFGGYGLIDSWWWWFGYYREEINYLGNQSANRTAIMNYITPYYSGF